MKAIIQAKGEPTKRELAILAFLNTYAVPYFTKNKITELINRQWLRTKYLKQRGSIHIINNIKKYLLLIQI